jgi:riboflavin kinase/FMN adenylyltransferase
LRQLLHGPGFALGKGREGTPELLERIGQQMGFDLDEVIPYVQPAKGILSSTVIRGLIADGQVQAAARGLGRAPTLTGTVVEGEKIGRTLGFPTANQSLDGPLAVPADGVYACWAEVAPFTAAVRRYAAAVSIGTRPTFDGETRAVEAYLLDFAGDLYGQKMRLHFVARLRGQERFDNIAALIAQMRRDVATARGVLRDAPESGDVEHLDLAADG